MRGISSLGVSAAFLSASLHLNFSTATTTYSSVERTLQYIADLPPHPSVSVFELKFPTTRASALQAFRVHLDALNAELQIAQRKIGNRTKLKIVAVINSISSRPGHLSSMERNGRSLS